MKPAILSIPLCLVYALSTIKLVSAEANAQNNDLFRVSSRKQADSTRRILLERTVTDSPNSALNELYSKIQSDSQYVQCTTYIHQPTGSSNINSSNSAPKPTGKIDAEPAKTVDNNSQPAKTPDVDDEETAALVSHVETTSLPEQPASTSISKPDDKDIERKPGSIESATDLSGETKPKEINWDNDKTAKPQSNEIKPAGISEDSLSTPKPSDKLDETKIKNAVQGNTKSSEAEPLKTSSIGVIPQGVQSVTNHSTASAKSVSESTKSPVTTEINARPTKLKSGDAHSTQASGTKSEDKSGAKSIATQSQESTTSTQIKSEQTSSTENKATENNPSETKSSQFVSSGSELLETVPSVIRPKETGSADSENEFSANGSSGHGNSESSEIPSVIKHIKGGSADGEDELVEKVPVVHQPLNTTSTKDDKDMGAASTEGENKATTSTVGESKTSSTSFVKPKLALNGTSAGIPSTNTASTGSTKINDKSTGTSMKTESTGNSINPESTGSSVDAESTGNSMDLNSNGTKPKKIADGVNTSSENIDFEKSISPENKNGHANPTNATSAGTGSKNAVETIGATKPLKIASKNTTQDSTESTGDTSTDSTSQDVPSTEKNKDIDSLKAIDATQGKLNTVQSTKSNEKASTETRQSTGETTAIGGIAGIRTIAGTDGAAELSSVNVNATATGVKGTATTGIITDSSSRTRAATETFIGAGSMQTDAAEIAGEDAKQTGSKTDSVNQIGSKTGSTNQTMSKITGVQDEAMKLVDGALTGVESEDFELSGLVSTSDKTKSGAILSTINVEDQVKNKNESITVETGKSVVDGMNTEGMKNNLNASSTHAADGLETALPHNLSIIKNGTIDAIGTLKAGATDAASSVSESISHEHANQKQGTNGTSTPQGSSVTGTHGASAQTTITRITVDNLVYSTKTVCPVEVTKCPATINKNHTPIETVVTSTIFTTASCTETKCGTIPTVTSSYVTSLVPCTLTDCKNAAASVSAASITGNLVSGTLLSGSRDPENQVSETAVLGTPVSGTEISAIPTASSALSGAQSGSSSYDGKIKGMFAMESLKNSSAHATVAAPAISTLSPTATVTDTAIITSTITYTREQLIYHTVCTCDVTSATPCFEKEIAKIRTATETQTPVASLKPVVTTVEAICTEECNGMKTVWSTVTKTETIDCNSLTCAPPATLAGNVILTETSLSIPAPINTAKEGQKAVNEKESTSTITIKHSVYVTQQGGGQQGGRSSLVQAPVRPTDASQVQSPPSMKRPEIDSKKGLVAQPSSKEKSVCSAHTSSSSKAQLPSAVASSTSNNGFPTVTLDIPEPTNKPQDFGLDQHLDMAPPVAGGPSAIASPKAIGSNPSAIGSSLSAVGSNPSAVGKSNGSASIGAINNSRLNSTNTRTVASLQPTPNTNGSTNGRGSQPVIAGASTISVSSMVIPSILTLWFSVLLM